MNMPNKIVLPRPEDAVKGCGALFMGDDAAHGTYRRFDAILALCASARMNSDNRAFVCESSATDPSGWIIRAAQSTEEAAESYMADDRLMVVCL